MTNTIELFDYKVAGSESVIVMLKNETEDPAAKINWFNFHENDIFYNSNGEGYVIKVNHGEKTVKFYNRFN